MTKIIITFLLFLPFGLIAQSKEKVIKYNIVSAVLNDLLLKINYGYYNFEKPIDPEIYELHHPDSIYTFIDFETYEEYSITGQNMTQYIVKNYLRLSLIINKN